MKFEVGNFSHTKKKRKKKKKKKHRNWRNYKQGLMCKNNTLGDDFKDGYSEMTIEMK